MQVLFQQGAFTADTQNAINQNFSVLQGGIFGASVYSSAFFVDATLGSNQNNGQTAVTATRTIGRALELAPAGSAIFITPGTYAENLIISRDYVSLIGGFSGYGRPDITPATGVPITVTGQGVTVGRVRCAGTAVDALVQTGNGFLIADCVLDGDLTAAKAGIRLIPSNTITSRTASEGRIFNCYFRSSAIGVAFDTALPAVGVGSSDNNIYSNIFSRNTLDMATADAGLALYSMQFTNIFGNQFVDKNKAVYLDFTTTNGGAASDQSGSVNGNYFATDTMSTTKIKAIGTAITFAGNYDTVGIFDGSGLD